MGKTLEFSMIPIEKTDVYRAVINRINKLIDDNELRPGDRIPSERELSEQLGVSRTTVRQGMKVLEAAGRIETRAGSGSYVTQTTPLLMLDLASIKIDGRFIRDLCTARAGIENMVFSEFIKGITPAKLKKVGKLLQQLQLEIETISSVNEGADADADYDLRFEQKVAELGGNKVLIAMQKQVHQLWAAAWSAYGCVPEKKAVLHIEHMLVFEALRRQDYELAIERIITHVKKGVSKRHSLPD